MHVNVPNASVSRARNIEHNNPTSNSTICTLTTDARITVTTDLASGHLQASNQQTPHTQRVLHGVMSEWDETA